MYLRNATNDFTIFSTKAEFASGKYFTGRNFTVMWTVGETADGGEISLGQYVVVVKDAIHNGGSFLAEGHSQGIVNNGILRF